MESNENNSGQASGSNPSGTGTVSTNNSSWWGSWINSTKEKTFSVFEAVKKDLDELSTTFQNEASNVGAAIENTLKFENNSDSAVGTVKKSLSSFFGQVTDALIPSMEDDETEAVLITENGLITLTGFPRHLAELQMNDKTYLSSPDEKLKEKYKRWMEVVEQDQFTLQRLDKHLASSEILNDKYTSLVPDQVSHMEFWQRYLFKRALLEDAVFNAEISERKAEMDKDLEKSMPTDKAIIQTEQPKLTLKEPEAEADIAEEVKEKKENKEKKEKKEKKEEKEKNQKKENFLEDFKESDLFKEWVKEEYMCNELSEEEQIRLLEEYEQEIKQKKIMPIKNLKKKKNRRPVKGYTLEQIDNESGNQNVPEPKKINVSDTTASNNNKTNSKTDNKLQKNVNSTKKTTTSGNKHQAQKDREEGSSSSTSLESWERFDLSADLNKGDDED